MRAILAAAHNALTPALSLWERGKSALVVLAAALCLSTAAMAEDTSSVIEPKEHISVEVKKGKLMKLPYAATSIMVADPEIADIDVQSPTMLYLYGKKVGQTTMYALDGDQHEAYGAVVSVEHNLTGLRAAVKDLMPQAAVNFRSVDNALVAEGAVGSPGDSADVVNLASSYLGQGEKLINLMKIGGSDQVLLRVRIAEVARSELKQFGIHLESLLTNGSFAFGLATGRALFSDEGDILRSGTTDSIFAGVNRGNADINGVIDALEDEGLMTILAEPNLTAMSGQPANFLAGGEFPIPVVEEDSVTINYRQFGVSLNFTPVVSSKERITLTVAPEVSTLSELGAVTTNGFNIPSLATRRASTTVELGSGQSFAIAGLLQNDTSNDVSKFPGLGDLPVLGALFRSTSFRRNETELVIIITPYVVRGVPEKELATPLDGFSPPSDIERILFGRMYKKTSAPGGEGATPLATLVGEMPRLHGPAGFVLE